MRICPSPGRMVLRHPLPGTGLRGEMVEARLVRLNGLRRIRRELHRPKAAFQRPTVEVESVGRLDDVEGLASGIQ